MSENTATGLVGERWLARRLGVTLSWIRAESEGGRIPCIATGAGRFIYHWPSVEQALIERASRANKPEEAQQ